MLSEYSVEFRRLKAIVFNYDNSLGVRLDAWSELCALMDSKDDADALQADACKGYAL